MLVRLLPCLLLLAACASTEPVAAPEQPELARLAQPYVPQLRAAGITRVVSTGSGAMVRLETFYGAVYVRYPRDVPPLAFVLDVDPDGLHAAAASFDRARDAPVLAAILPAAIRETVSNNEMQWVRANPWN